MVKVNEGFRQLPESYLFSEVGHRVAAYRSAHPDADIIRMDIGDVSRPLSRLVAATLCDAAAGMATPEGFHGYGPEQGYDFLREAIAQGDYRRHGISIAADEIFVSDGAKCDLAGLGDILSQDCRVAVPDPAYPVYVDDNVLQGRGGDYRDGRWSRLIYLNADPGDGFMAPLPEGDAPDVIMMCYPNNPTGTSISLQRLQQWVDYARSHGSLIIYDSAYEAYVRTPGMVRSVYEAEGAREVAIEVRSYSKTAGFTGLRCGYTVVPSDLTGRYADGCKVRLRDLWLRRQTTMFNGASYLSQKGAAVLYTEEGEREVRRSTDYYLRNAGLIRESLLKAGFRVSGGVDSPYVWTSLDGEDDSWSLFDKVLDLCHISTTPGEGFGRNGRGFLRLTGFNTFENTLTAMTRLVDALGKH